MEHPLENAGWNMEFLGHFFAENSPRFTFAEQPTGGDFLERPQLFTFKKHTRRKHEPRKKNTSYIPLKPG